MDPPNHQYLFMELQKNADFQNVVKSIPYLCIPIPKQTKYIFLEFSSAYILMNILAQKMEFLDRIR